jgi:hypothetical protein
MDKPANTKVAQELEHYSTMVLQQVISKKWSEIEVQEQEVEEFLLFPEKIYQRKKDGSWGETPCMLHPLRNHEKRKARKAARDIAEREKIDPERDADLFNDLDTMCIMYFATRSTTAPFEPLYGSPEEFERKFDRDVIKHMFGVLDDYSKLLDPQLDSLNQAQTLALIAAIVEGRSIRPLRAYGGAAQVSFIITMADLLTSLANGKLLPELFEVSTPER